MGKEWYHDVVIIDAGSNGIQEILSKGDVNKAVMSKFWRACKEHCVGDENLLDEVKEIWNSVRQPELAPVLERVSSTWAQWPYLTNSSLVSIPGIWQGMLAEKDMILSKANTTAAFKVMEAVGRYTARTQWTATCALEC